MDRHTSGFLKGVVLTATLAGAALLGYIGFSDPTEARTETRTKQENLENLTENYDLKFDTKPIINDFNKKSPPYFGQLDESDGTIFFHDNFPKDMKGFAKYNGELYQLTVRHMYDEFATFNLPTELMKEIVQSSSTDPKKPFAFSEEVKVYAKDIDGNTSEEASIYVSGKKKEN